MNKRLKTVNVNHIIIRGDVPQLNILHITDIHGHNVNSRDNNLWEKAASLEIDAVFITGDLIRYISDEFMPHFKGLKALASRAPTFFVFGNHEAHVRPEISEMMSEAGVIVLNNESIKMNFDGQVLPIFGFDDGINNFDRAKAQFNEFVANNPGFKLVMSHRPWVFDNIKENGPLLLLSGHTHGGQIRLPFMPTIYAPDKGFLPPYGKGLFRHKNALLYVSSGIGGTYFPLRLFNPPEIVLFSMKP